MTIMMMTTTVVEHCFFQVRHGENAKNLHKRRWLLVNDVPVLLKGNKRRFINVRILML